MESIESPSPLAAALVDPTRAHQQCEPQHPGIEAVIRKLREMLNDNDPSVHAEALVALGNFAGKGAPPAELKSLYS